MRCCLPGVPDAQSQGEDLSPRACSTTSVALNRFDRTSAAAIIWMVCATSTLSRAQDLGFHPFTVSAAGGVSGSAGADGQGVGLLKLVQAGAGVSFWNGPEPDRSGGVQQGIQHRWSLFVVNGTFSFEQASIGQTALNQAIAANPQNTALLSATSASVKYFTLTFDPTFRYLASEHLHMTLYGLGSVGWLRREVDFSGTSGPVSVIQPSAAAVFAPSASSAALGGGGGANFDPFRGKGPMFYVEARYLRGFSSNSGASLIPISFGLRW